MAKIGIYRNYRFIDKDPICDALRTMIRSDEHLKNNQVHEISGVAAQTIDGWLDGATRRPQNATVCQVSAALGYVRHDRLRKDGTLEVGFEKVSVVDHKKEKEKQATWFLKHHGHAPRRKNGQGKQ